MDVHDTPDISRSLPLQPGMVITIEPGKKMCSQWWTFVQVTLRITVLHRVFSWSLRPKHSGPFLLKLGMITGLENLNLILSQSHYSIRKPYFPPRHSQANKLWELTLRKCLCSIRQSSLRLLAFDPQQHRWIAGQRSRVNSLVLWSVWLWLNYYQSLVAWVSWTLQPAITGIHNLSLQTRHFTMNPYFFLSLDLELSAENWYLRLGSSLFLFRTLLKS